MMMMMVVMIDDHLCCQACCFFLVSCFIKLDLARLWGRVKMWSDTLQWWTVRLGMWQCILVAGGVFVGVEVTCRCWYVSIMCFMLMLKVRAMSILHCCLGSRRCSQALSHYPVDYELVSHCQRYIWKAGFWFWLLVSGFTKYVKPWNFVGLFVGLFGMT